jgi:monofunctional biosynthetic peptidoglycan transglycosylase
MIVDFSTDAPMWRSIDDRVMGGVSASEMISDGGVAVFRGVVSLENSGGFASVRSDPARYDLTGLEGVLLRVRGDGKSYGFSVRTTAAFDGVSYQARFTTVAGEWLEIALPFDQFVPVYRGRRVSDHPPLDPAGIRTFGLMIADRQAGPFRLELEWIRGLRVER